MVPVYVIVRVDITDRQQYQKYLAVAPSIVQKYGGRVIARSETAVTLEGPEEKRKIVLIEFSSIERVRGFYDSPEYRHARGLRAESASGEMIVVDGLIPG
jgi:uncharacterized protein (DUF1330 family)